MKNKTILLLLVSQYLLISSILYGQQNLQKDQVQSNPPIYIAFLWHMHQPIYWPYESVVTTINNNRYPFSVLNVFNDRTGPYNDWPKNAVQAGINAGLGNFGAQVSFSGSLIENLNNLQANGNGNFSNWKSHWNNIKNQNTVLGNPRLDMVGFGYFHPLMPLIGNSDIRKHLQKQKSMMQTNFTGSYSKGIFPPENAFAPWIIPPLVEEGLEWVLVDNAHFERATTSFPYSGSNETYQPNRADQINPDPNDWVQLNGLWAPNKISARWAHQPHYAEYTDPATGTKKKMIVVPASRYLGNEDGRGGFGALNYEAVMSQLESFNTDPNHPMLIVLHHDGDNHGGGSSGYYGSNFTAFVNWVKTQSSRFVCTTIQDYLELYPPSQSDVIHVESGSWVGADAGDPEFKKWLGDPDGTGYSPDRNSWATITAAQNYVAMAEQLNPGNTAVTQAWDYIMVGQSSDYWYWDNSLNGIWDSHPTRASNQAVALVQGLVTGTDLTPPTLFMPQREPYNPGGKEYGQTMPKDFKVFTYAYDVNGLQSVTLKYRVDLDGVNSLSSSDNETYAGGAEVGTWISIPMNGIDIPSQTTPPPTVKAKEYSAMVSGLSEKLVDYYVEAVDANGNITKSAIKHVWVGAESGGGGGGTGVVSWLPVNPTKNDTITITVQSTLGGKLHWGVNNSGSNWQTPNQVYWTPGTALFGNGPAVESPFAAPDTAGKMILKIGPFNNSAQAVERVAFVIHYNDNTWNNNNGQDFNISFGGSTQSFVMDGALDQGAVKAASNSGTDLYIGWNGTDIYVATQSAQSAGKDVFLFISDSLRASRPAPWSKSGSVNGWSLFLANESSNNYITWSDQTIASQKAAGGFAEGYFNVQSEFGYVPATLYLAVGQYQTADNGVLQNQVPAGNGNGDIESGEWFAYQYNLVDVADDNVAPAGFSLDQNYPNPFNPSTAIRFSVPQRSHVTLSVYDVLGREIRTLIDQEYSTGTYTAHFDASGLPSGIYFYRLTAGSHTSTRKMQLLK